MVAVAAAAAATAYVGVSGRTVALLTSLPPPHTPCLYSAVTDLDGTRPMLKLPRGGDAHPTPNSDEGETQRSVDCPGQDPQVPDSKKSKGLPLPQPPSGKSHGEQVEPASVLSLVMLLCGERGTHSSLPPLRSSLLPSSLLFLPLLPFLQMDRLNRWWI